MSSCPRYRPAARAILIWGVSCFIGGQLALLLCMERWRPELRDPELGRKLAYLCARRAEHPDRPLLLMLGSSRTLQGFRAADLTGQTDVTGQPLLAFNFGLAGAGPLKTWTCLRELLAAGVRPDRLLIEILPPLLNEPGPSRMSEENWLAVPRLAAADVADLRHFHSRPGWLCRTWARSLLLPGYTHRVRICSWLVDNSLGNGSATEMLAPMDPFGWQPLAHEVTDAAFRRQLTARVAEQYHAAFQDFRLGAGQGRALRDLLERCQRERIRSTLVLMPEGTAFRRLYAPQMHAALDAFLTDLQQRYRAELIDARDWIADSGFYDSHHLQPSAAAEFSNRLASCVLQQPIEEKWN